MGVLDLVRGRNDSRHVQESIVTTEPNEPKTTADVPEDNAHESPGKTSLEQQNEKEIMQHPDEVTASAQLGVKKAEAAALVWSKKAVYATYAW